MNISETDDAPKVERRGGPRPNSGGKRPGVGRPRKGSPSKVKARRKDINQLVEQWEASAEMEVRAQAARQYLAKVNQEMQAEAKAEPEIPKHMLTKNGRLRKFTNMHSAGLALINDPTVSPDTKAKLIIGLTQYEKPRLAEKALGKKEERNIAAQTAGRSGEFDGLMEPPKGPRLVVNGS